MKSYCWQFLTYFAVRRFADGFTADVRGEGETGADEVKNGASKDRSVFVKPIARVRVL